MRVKSSALQSKKFIQGQINDVYIYIYLFIYIYTYDYNSYLILLYTYITYDARLIKRPAFYYLYLLYIYSQRHDRILFDAQLNNKQIISQNKTKTFISIIRSKFNIQSLVILVVTANYNRIMTFFNNIWQLLSYDAI